MLWILDCRLSGCLLVWAVIQAIIGPVSSVDPYDQQLLNDFLTHFPEATEVAEWKLNISDACNPTLWAGITCDVAGHITAIKYEFDDNVTSDFAISPYKGTLPCSIFDFPFLTSFGFFGHTTSFLGQLSSCTNICTNNSVLQSFNVGKNGLSGSIPSGFKNCASLTDLRLNKNYFNGSLPADLFDSQKITDFFVDENFLTGTVPSALWNLPNLNQLDLSMNRFYGELPASFPSNAKIKQFKIASNSFSGQLPDWFWELASNHVPNETVIVANGNRFDCDFANKLTQILSHLNKNIGVYDQPNCKPPPELMATPVRHIRFTPYRDETLHQLPQTWEHEFGMRYIQVRRSGLKFYIFGKSDENTVFEDEYVCLSFQSIVYGTKDGSSLNPPAAEFVFADYTSQTELAPGRWIYNTTLPAPYNANFAITWDLNRRPQSAKFTLDFLNFPHDKTNAYFKFPFQYYIKTPIASTGTQIIYERSQDLYQNIYAPRFTSGIMAAFDLPDDDGTGISPQLGVRVSATTPHYPKSDEGVSGIAFSFVSGFRIDGVPIAGLDKGIKTSNTRSYVLPWGNIEILEDLPQRTDTPPENVQGFSLVSALELKMGFEHSWHFDPDIALLFVGDTSPSAPPSSEEGYIVAVAVVIPLVVVIVVVLLTVFRRKVFPFLYRGQDKLKMTSETLENSKTTEMKTPAAKQSRNWTPSVTGSKITNI